MPTVGHMEIVIREEPDPGRYVIDVDGAQAGLADYHLRGDDVYFFVHTEIGDEFAGQQLGSRLIRHALDDVRSKGAKLVPICPFVARFIDRYPEYADLIDEPIWERIKSRSHPTSKVAD